MGLPRERPRGRTERRFILVVKEERRVFGVSEEDAEDGVTV